MFHSSLFDYTYLYLGNSEAKVLEVCFSICRGNWQPLTPHLAKASQSATSVSMKNSHKAADLGVKYTSYMNIKLYSYC